MLSRFFESKFFEGMGKFVDVLILSIFFCICSLPIFTMGASMTALYYATHKTIYQGRGYSTEFFKAFKNNFKQSTLSWLIFLVLGIILGSDFYITYQMNVAGQKLGGFCVVFLIFLIIEFAWIIYHFAYIARFQDNFKTTFKNSGIFVIMHFTTTVLAVILAFLFFSACYVCRLLIPFAPGFFALCVHQLLEKVFRKYMSKEDIIKEDEIMGIYHDADEEENEQKKAMLKS